MVATTISCDATILRCSRCQFVVAVASATATPGTCTCGAPMIVDRSCDRSFTLRNSAPLIRCIAENKESWRCVDGSSRDYCADHAHLAETIRVPRPHESSHFLDDPPP